MTHRDVSLALGLVSLGRRWGFRPGEPPPRDAARALLHHAVARGIRLLDTAPAYGDSEIIVGEFLGELGERAATLTVATKMGEHWIGAEAGTRADHSFEALRASVDESLRRLGRIDVMQIHKADIDNIHSADVLRALDYCRSKGIGTFGVSASDSGTLLAACESPHYSMLQFPYSRANTRMADVFAAARRHEMRLLVNRPFAMGELIPETGAGKSAAMRDALAFVLDQDFSGHILTGTRNPAHLDETIAAFAAQ
jgi:aryl-alcohol dehydrogenase-like predicted oxidoreductase